MSEDPAPPGTPGTPRASADAPPPPPGAALSFGETLRHFRVAKGWSQAAIAALAGMDRSYVNRLEAGERGAPAPPAVEALAAALELTSQEADQLFIAAGLLPQSLRALGPADPTITLLAQRLTDPALSPASRAALRATISLILRHWGDRPDPHNPGPEPGPAEHAGQGDLP